MSPHRHVRHASHGDSVHPWSSPAQVSLDFSPSLHRGSHKSLYMEGGWTIFQLYEFIAFHVYKEISDNVYLKINLDFMHTHLYLNFHLVYIHICKEENVSVCGACISVVKKSMHFLLAVISCSLQYVSRCILI